MNKVSPILLAIVLFFLANAASAQQASPAADDQPGDIYFFVRYDIGATNSGITQTLPDGWPARFQPPAGSMTTKANDSPWFGEIGLGIGPKWDTSKGEIAVLIFYNFIGLSSMQKRFYSLHRPVAGIELDWGDPVRLQTTSVLKTSPEFGIAYTWKRLTIHPSVQTYRLFTEDYRGEDGESKLDTQTNRGSGIGTRIDVQYRVNPQSFFGKRLDPWNTSAVGLFYERNGGRVWTMGVSLQVGMELITRHRRPTN